MTFVRDLSGNSPLDVKYSPYNRTAADLTAILALTPLYVGEIVMALNTGRKYRALGGTSWGLIGPVTAVIAGTIPQPSVTINQAAGQADPALAGPILFTAVFSHEVTGFVTGDVTFTGTAGGTKVGTVTGGPLSYTVTVTGMTTAGTVIANIAAGVATGVGGTNLASSSTDNTVTWSPDVTAPTVTINQAGGQGDPTDVSPITFTVVFNEPVIGFATGDVTITGTAGGTKAATVSGSSPTYTVEVTGMTTGGTVIASIGAGVCTDIAGNANLASTSSDNTVTWAPDIISPSVTINKAAGQADPTSTSPILFDIVFSEPVVGFAAADVTVVFSGGGTPAASLSGSGATWTASVTGMTTDGNVTATIAAGVCADAAGNPNLISSSTDNVVAWVAPVTPSGIQTYFFISGQY